MSLSYGPSPARVLRTYPEREPAVSIPEHGRVPVLATAIALVLANVRYWSRVAPLVRRELSRWNARAATIPDRSLRELASGKLHAEDFNAEVAATLATLAPRAHRARVVRAIVAFEVLYDYLDGLTERLGPGALEQAECLYRPFAAAFELGPERLGERAGAAHRGEVPGDGGYAAELAASVRAAFGDLPSRAAVAAVAGEAARRCAQAQVRAHAAAYDGGAELERWARERAAGTGLDWRGFVAGSVASVLSVHALIAAAAEPSVREGEPEAIDRAYLLTSALSTMLDALVDYEHDVRAGEPWLARLYGGPAPLAEQLGVSARRAVALAQRLPHRAHHTMTLLGVVAYYTSAPEAGGATARVPFRRLHRELRPVILPTLAVMRAWRLAKRLRGPSTRGRRVSRGRGGRG